MTSIQVKPQAVLDDDEFSGMTDSQIQARLMRADQAMLDRLK
jgi:hypothetical protein